MTITETVQEDPRFPGLDRTAIITKMIEAIFDKRHWDDESETRFPSGPDHADPYEEIAAAYRVKGRQKTRNTIIDWACGRFDETKQKLAQVPLSPRGYLLHRLMTVPETWGRKVRMKGGTNLGIYWTYDLASWDRVGAHPPWSNDSLAKEIVIEAYVSPDAVDWNNTFLANMDWVSGDIEFEIRLRKGAPLDVTTLQEYHYERKLFKDMSGMVFTA